ncbi:MAG TPA: hypothetical protein PLC07_12195 [Bacillota bacterium]|nr:hypothetical protein [Bacillota bacterium]HPT86417.1 hypothetical protein [Bacillota bacterium]
MAEPLSIIGILVERRAQHAPDLQEIITKHGENILCRMGIPSPSKENGLITLVYKGDLKQAEDFQHELEAMPGVHIQRMSFLQ